MGSTAHKNKSTPKFGLSFYDEYHQAFSESRVLAATAPSDSILLDRAPAFYMTGTLIDNNLAVPVVALKILQRHYEWTGKEGIDVGSIENEGEVVKCLSSCWWVNIKAGVASVNAVVNSYGKNTIQDRVLKSAARTISGVAATVDNYVFNKSSRTQWLNGRPATAMPSHQHKDVDIPLDDRYLPAMTSLCKQQQATAHLIWKADRKAYLAMSEEEKEAVEEPPSEE